MRPIADPAWNIRQRPVSAALMSLELLSTAMLAAFIWSLIFLLPRAMKARDGMALTTAVLSALLAALAWLFLSGGIRSR